MTKKRRDDSRARVVSFRIVFFLSLALSPYTPNVGGISVHVRRHTLIILLCTFTLLLLLFHFFFRPLQNKI